MYDNVMKGSKTIDGLGQKKFWIIDLFSLHQKKLFYILRFAVNETRHTSTRLYTTISR